MCIDRAVPELIINRFRAPSIRKNVNKYPFPSTALLYVETSTPRKKPDSTIELYSYGK